MNTEIIERVCFESQAIAMRNASSLEEEGKRNKRVEEKMRSSWKRYLKERGRAMRSNANKEEAWVYHQIVWNVHWLHGSQARYANRLREAKGCSCKWIESWNWWRRDQAKCRKDYLRIRGENQNFWWWSCTSCWIGTLIRHSWYFNV